MFDLSVIWDEVPTLLYGIPITIGLAVASFAIGCVAGLPLALIRVLKIPGLNALAIGFIEFFRTTPQLIHIIWAYYVFPAFFGLSLSAFTVVVIALSCSTAAMMAEVFRAGIDAVPRGQTNAARVLGFSPWQKYRYVILPQTSRLILPPTASVSVISMKETALAAIIAVPELMHRGNMLSAQTFRPVEVLTTVAIIYFFLTYPLVMLTKAAERRFSSAYNTI